MTFFLSKCVIIVFTSEKKSSQKSILRVLQKSVKKFCKILDFSRFSQSKLHFKFILTDFFQKLWRFFSPFLGLKIFQKFVKNYKNHEISKIFNFINFQKFKISIFYFFEKKKFFFLEYFLYFHHLFSSGGSRTSPKL